MKRHSLQLAAITLFLFISPFFAHASIIDVSTYSAFSDKSMAGYWTFDGKNMDWTGGNAHDSSSANNTASMQNMISSVNSIPGKSGQGVFLDGSATFMYLSSNPFTIPGPTSACAWAYTKDITAAPGAWNQSFINFANNTSNGVRIGNIANTGALFVSYKIGGTSVGAQSSGTVFANNKWVYVCYVWNGSGVSLYANGVSLATTTNTDSIGNSSEPGVIGARDDEGGGNWYGGLDNLQVYNRVLSAAEIRKLYGSTGGGVQNASVVPTPGNPAPTAWWTFDAKNMNWGSSLALDSSGNGNSLTAQNMTQSGTTILGKIGQGLLFNGSNQNAVDTSYSQPPSGDVTMSAWIYMTGGAASNSVISLANNSAASRNILYMEMGGPGTTIGFNAFRSGSFSGWSSTGSVPGNTWAHVAVVYHNGTGIVDFYINGKLDSSTSCSGGSCTGLPTGINTAVIGSFADDNGTYLNYFHGRIDDAQIFNRALSATEIQKVYAEGFSGTKVGVSQKGTANLGTGLVGWWTLDGQKTNWATGSTLDSSGQGNAGQLLGMSTTTSPVPGKIGQALNFNGSTQNVLLPTAVSSAFASKTAASISLWINEPTTQGQYARAFSMYADNQHDLSISFNSSAGGGNNEIDFNVMDPSGDGTQFIQSASNVFSPHSWHMITVVFDGSLSTATQRGKIYLDGTLLSSTYGGGPAFPTQIASSLGQASIGSAAPFPGSLNFNGRIDDVRVYNRALAPGDVSQLYNLGK